MTAGQLMAAETSEIPAVVERALAYNREAVAALGNMLRDRRQPSIVTCARGSSDHAAGYFAYLAGIVCGAPVASVGPSLASVYHAPLDFTGRVVVSVSQSGESPDLVAFQAAARAAGAETVALVNHRESPLAAGADHVLSIAAGPERSVPATKSAVGAMAVLAALVAAWSGNRMLAAGLERLAATCERALSLDWGAAAPVLATARSAYLVGRGPSLPIAMEAALKLKETAAIHAEALSGAEIMHGPLQLVEPDFPVLMFAPRDAAAPSIHALRDRLAAAGARTLFASPDAAGSLPCAETGCPMLDPLPMLVSFYRLAADVAIARGHDPDRPTRLNKVTRTI